MIYVTGDVHGDLSRFEDKRLKKLKKGDSLIICGDFGLIWDGSDREKKILKRLGKRKYNILFLVGAHENFEELEKYEVEEWKGGITRRISGNLRYLQSGSIFNIDDKDIFVFGGGRGEENGGEAPCPEEIGLRYEVPDKELIEKADLSLKERDNKVDYIVSYSPPLSIAEFLVGSSAVSDTPSTYLERKKGELNFKRWFFGKYHITKLIPPRYMGIFNEVIAAE